MSKLNKTQIYAIRWLDSQGMITNQIAEELNLLEKQIVSTLEKYAQSKTPETEDLKTVKSSVVPGPKAKDLMITHTSGKKNNSVAIMTKEASEVGDEMKKRLKSNGRTDDQKGIFRPNKK
jgi:orotate phosphoribosyltransferase-like protein